MPLWDSTRTASSGALAQRPATTSYCESSRLWSSSISLKALALDDIMVPAMAALEAPPP